MKLLSRFIATIVITHLLFAGHPALAGTASFSLSVASRPVEVGNNFVVNVSLNPSGAAVDTARAIVSFSSDTISAVNVSLVGILDSPSPGNTINNGAGTISWGGFTVDKQQTTSGLFARITFKAIASGNATIGLNSASRIISNGEEVGNSASGNQVAVTTIPATGTSAASALALTSTTHPNQETWYQATTATLHWNGGANTTYLWQWDHEPDTVPTQTTKDTTKTFRNVKSGIWYFHLQSRSADGNLSEPVHYRVQVDNVKPNPIEPYLDVDDQQQLTIRFATTDYHSGVSSYDLRVNQEDIENAPNPYVLRGLNVGENFIVVTAYDLAGNVRQGWVKFILNSDGTIRDITVSDTACRLPFGCDAQGYVVLIGIPTILLATYLFYIRRRFRLVTIPASQQPTPATPIVNPDGTVTRTHSHTHTHTYTDTDTYTDTPETPSTLEKPPKKGSGKKRHRG